MGDLRVRYGLSYGRQNNFYSGVAGQKGILAGTDGLISQGDTTPDVTNGVLFYTNNSGATSITNFDLTSVQTGPQIGMFEGKEIKLVFLDSNTTISGPRIFLSNSDNSFNRNSYLELMYHGSAWYETGRSNIYRDAVTINFAGSSGLNANFVTSFILQVTGAAPVIVSISDGRLGQVLNVINGNSSAAISISTAGNITAPSLQPGTAGAGIITLVAGGAAQFIKTAAASWALETR